MAEVAHPREVFTYEGGEGVERAWLDALERGRMHHAWLLTGPEGVGKATFAYRAARRLLGARPDPDYGPMGASPDDPVSRQVAARSHPDLMVLERAVEDGKLKKFIPIDQARRLPEFFSKSPSQAAWRVAIIDAADDMNPNAANAVLKTLEEPPERGVLFLVSHAPGRLLPTIRSRCRRLAFSGWDEARAAAFVVEHAGVNLEEGTRLARMAGGAPGRAVALAEAGALELDRLAHELLRKLPQTDDPALLALADGFRKADGPQRFELLFERLADQVHAMAVAPDQPTSAALDRWAAIWERLSSLPS